MPDPSLIVHFETLGCRLNQDETEGAAHCFSQNGFSVDMESVTASTKENMDVVLCVVNTCTVTGKAEQKARRIIRLLLEKYPSSIVLVTGCYAELDGANIESINPDRIGILKGTKKYLLTQIAQQMSNDKLLFSDEGLVSLDGLKKFINDKSSQSLGDSLENSKLTFVKDKSLDGKSDLFSLFTPVFEKHSRGSIKIQDGCNCACSFCRIHFARGKSISLYANEVVRRVKQMEESGIEEVVFTGVNLSQYSSLDSYGETLNLSGLLSLVLKNTKKILLRISSLYPQAVNQELCDILKDKRIQPFFHLSIQSGSDRILELMRRPHSVDNVIKSIELLRKAKDDPFISCDLIAGFPGESEEDFELTKKLCNISDFAWIHAFPFSPRPGTPAMNMKPQIPERIKGERVKILSSIALEGKLSYIKRWEGKKVTAIVENSRSLRNCPNGNIIHAVTENYLHVECTVSDSSIYRPGQKVDVIIGDALEDSIRNGKETECKAFVV